MQNSIAPRGLFVPRRLVIMSRMSEQTDSPPPIAPPDHTGVVTAGLLMMIIGWGGLWLLVMTTLPTAFPRWLFFVLLYLAVTGTVLPFVRFLNARFLREGELPPSGGVILRQSIWVGLFVVACAWLQIPRVLNPVLAFFLALSLIMIEVFLRLREQHAVSES
jgi:hypothetical protein